MSITVQLRRDIRSDCEAATPADGEAWYDQSLKTLRLGDGATLGGSLLKKWGKSKIISPTQITANQNDYNPTDLSIAELLYLDLDADRTITGMAGGATDREITLHNASLFRLTLANSSASSTAANRFAFIAGDLVVRSGQSVRLAYSAALSRYIALGRGDLGITQLPEDIYLTGDISPAQITANTNDYSPTGLSTASRLRLSTDASRDLTGLTGGAAGRLVHIVNVGTNTLVLKDASASSTAANRFDFGADVSLDAKRSAALLYDATDSRWKLLASTAGAAVAAGAVTAQTMAASSINTGAIVNGYLAWSVAGSALTVALKTLAGANPSAADPVYVLVRNATVTDGSPTILTITAALSLVVSSGSSLGASGGNVPFRIWAVIFNDAGTPRLGVINCMTGSQIYPLSAWPIASSTAEGGAGAADNAHIFYTGTAVAAKPYAVAGYGTWETGLATAGTWASAPTNTHGFLPGTPLPGQRLRSSYTSTGGMATGTTVIPFDNTIPQNSEGDQYMTLAHTPVSAANLLDIAALVNGYHSASNSAAALFQDSVANALTAGWSPSITANQIKLNYRQLAATAVLQTFKVRAGGLGAGTYTFNGAAGAAEFGGALLSSMAIEEIMG